MFGIVLIGLSGCIRRSENQVVLYCAVDREFATPIVNAFSRANESIEVNSQFDVEATKSVGLANRILQEKSTTRCDVFWNGEILQTIRLQQEGLLLQRRWNLPDDLRGGFNSEGYWAPGTARARVLLVNKDQLTDPTGWPKSVLELSDPKWTKQCAFASPLFGSTSTHFSVLAAIDGDSFWSWIKQAQDNAIVLSGNKQVAQAVAQGKVAWGLTDTDDALIEKENGANVEIVFPDQEENQVGILMIPSTIAVLRDAPHPVAAGQLADYLASKETSRRLTMATAAQFNLWPSEKLTTQFEGAEQLKLMKADFKSAADQWASTMEKLNTMFRNDSAVKNALATEPASPNSANE